AYSRWLINTVVLGAGFVVSQLFAWRQLVRQGVYMASNPYSSFFYLFTAAHGLHLLGGIFALTYLLLRTTKKRATIDGELRRIGAEIGRASCRERVEVGGEEGGRIIRR